MPCGTHQVRTKDLSVVEDLVDRSICSIWYSLAQRTMVSIVAPGLLAAAYNSGASRFLASVSQNSALWMVWETEAAWVSQ